jgi:hypothetical protein
MYTGMHFHWASLVAALLSFVMAVKCISPLGELYLKTVASAVTGILLETDAYVPGTGNASTLKRQPFNLDRRIQGLDWPTFGYTMVGERRLANVRHVLEQCLMHNVPGDFVECGVWRGGSSIYAKAVLTAHHAEGRRVVLVDSFDGLPKAELAVDSDVWSMMHYLRVSQQQVRAHFKHFGLLDDNVVFVQGFFKISAPKLASDLRAANRQIAVLRLDGDMYQSLADCLYNLYEYVAIGGFVIIDDWSIKVAMNAVEDFRSLYNITDELHTIDWTGVFWRKTKQVLVNTTQRS